MCQASEDELGERERGEYRDSEDELLPIERDDEHAEAVGEESECGEPQEGIDREYRLPEVLGHERNYTIPIEMKKITCYCCLAVGVAQLVRAEDS